LSGASFRSSINASYRTGAQLLDFITKQMPADHPGSLSATAYANVTAYVLSRNGFPAGTTRLSAANAGRLQLAGKRLVTQQQQQKVEIVRAAAPVRKVWAAIPAATSVDVTDAMMQNAASDGKDWLLGGKTWANDRYSPLTQITSQNVASLTPVAIVQTGFTASFEATPVVVNGVMYISTPVVNNQMKVMAVNAATGARYWETTYNLTPFKICCGPVNRGVAVAYGNVYVTTLDDRLLALDARNGSVRFNVRVADPSVGYSETMTPQIYNNKVIVGSAGGEWAIAGFVAAYDARNGRQLWRWNATDPKSYSGDSWKRGGAMAWTTPAFDPRLGLVIFSTGNPNPDLDGTPRRGDNLWSDSIVALDVNTGKLRWYYQEVKHDVWDYDAVSPVVLFDVTVNGRTVPAAGEAGKVGWFFIVNRENGQLIRKSDPYVKFSKNMFTTPTKAGVNMLPGANGGAEWSPPAYSPQTHYAYVLAMDQLMKFTTQPAKSAPGQLRLGSAFTNVQPNGLQDGPLVAIDTETGKLAWTHMTKQPLIGGALATAGNLVFFGEGDGDFNALDAKSGQLLWHYHLGAGVNAPPISYEVDGTQYVAVAAGGNFQLDYPYGDAVAIFKLGSTSAAGGAPPAAATPAAATPAARATP
jgi:PQQ-dependent dehydrogenase (methanol/ethanol family)